MSENGFSPPKNVHSLWIGWSPGSESSSHRPSHPKIWTAVYAAFVIFTVERAAAGFHRIPIES